LSGDAVSFYPVWFIWAGLFTFCCFRRAVAAGHMVFVAMLYAATLVNYPPQLGGRAMADDRLDAGRRRILHRHTRPP